MARCFGLGVVELPPNFGALLLDKVISMFYISVIETAVREIQGREEKKHQNKSSVKILLIYCCRRQTELNIFKPFIVTFIFFWMEISWWRSEGDFAALNLCNQPNFLDNHVMTLEDTMPWLLANELNPLADWSASSLTSCCVWRSLKCICCGKWGSDLGEFAVQTSEWQWIGFPATEEKNVLHTFFCGSCHWIHFNVPVSKDGVKQKTEFSIGGWLVICFTCQYQSKSLQLNLKMNTVEKVTPAVQ